MRNGQKKQKGTQPGLWPAGQSKDGLEKSILYYKPNNLTTHNHLSRFLEYLEYAELPGALAALTKLYLAYQMIPEAPQLLNNEEKDDLSLIIAMFADIARAEGRYLSEDRQELLEDLYGHNDERSSHGS